MCVAAYYIVFAMRNKSTIVNSKNIQILYYCFTSQCMIHIIYLSILFDRNVLRLTSIDINMYII